MNWRARIAYWLAPTLIDERVNERVADVLFKMDPFEPFLRKYNVIFSKDWERAEDRLDEQSRLRLFMWAYSTIKDPSFVHLTNFVKNTQGNNTLRRGTNEREWDFGRSAIVTVELLVREVGRLAARYEELMAGRDDMFNPNVVDEI